MPIQQMLLGVGASKKTYVDDIFSTYVYAGNSTARSINNGLDLSGEGGMLWVKRRNQSEEHIITDTVRGAENYIASSNSDGSNSSSGISSFNSTGFSLGTANHVNGSNHTYASWSFRKTPGFFDVVTWTGNGVAGRQISHSLSSIPGCIMIKCTSNAFSWTVGHRSLNSGTDPWDYHLMLHNSDDEADSALQFNDTAPTSTHFTVGTANTVNGSGKTYVAYVFAGGESTSDNAVSFDGTDDRLTLADSSDFTFGTGDFTIEGWFNKSDAAATGFFQISDTTGGLNASTSDSIQLAYSAFNSSITLVYNDTFHHQSYSYTPDKYCHFAVCRKGSTIKVFIDGVELISKSDSKDYDFGNLCIGGRWDTSNLMKGKIANFRIVKGQALYTQGFTPPTEVFTTSSRDAESSKVKLICCNGSTTTAATVTPGTITAVGDPTVASSESIFDDTSANVFGDSGDQNVIKCGSYIGNGSSSGPKINLGWEPSWVMIKISSGANYGWTMLDTMRGIPTGGNNARLRANESGAEDTAMGELINVNPTGFQLKDSTDSVNASGNTYVYMAIRRPDGYVGKPPELGTGVFTMDTGNSSSTIPTFDSGFPVDMALRRAPASSMSFWLSTRLQGPKDLGTASGYSGSESTDANSYTWDSNAGWASQSGWSSSQQSWMWKRHAGFDVVAYDSPGGSNTHIRHSLSKVPEMMWVKKRDATGSWFVYHKGLNGGSNPYEKYLILNSTDAEAGDSGYLWYAAPTSTSFILGSSGNVNSGGNDYIAMLFASVDGISKVGYYDGSDSSQTITTGFQPRFWIVKSTTDAYPWLVLDTLRGWGSGNDKYLALNSSDAEQPHDFGAPTSTGFTMTSSSHYNKSGKKYIYYAHA